MCCSSEEGSYLRLKGICITQLQAREFRVADDEVRDEAEVARAAPGGRGRCKATWKRGFKPYINTQQFRRGLVFKTERLLYHSTPGGRGGWFMTCVDIRLPKKKTTTGFTVHPSGVVWCSLAPRILQCRGSVQVLRDQSLGRRSGGCTLRTWRERRVQKATWKREFKPYINVLQFRGGLVFKAQFDQ